MEKGEDNKYSQGREQIALAPVMKLEALRMESYITRRQGVPDPFLCLIFSSLGVLSEVTRMLGSDETKAVCLAPVLSRHLSTRQSPGHGASEQPAQFGCDLRVQAGPQDACASHCFGHLWLFLWSAYRG